MKNLTKKTRTKIENLTEQQGSVERKELDNNQLRLITGGMPIAVQPCSCTQCGDEDCD